LAKKAGSVFGRSNTSASGLHKLMMYLDYQDTNVGKIKFRHQAGS